MENLQSLYDEIAPKFYELKSKHSEMEKRTHELSGEIEQAKANYDPKKVTKLTAEETSTYQVRDRIKEDLKEYQKKNGGILLLRKVADAAEADFKKDNQLMQGRFKERDELRRKADVIDQEIKKETLEARERYTEPIGRFSKIIGRDMSSNVISIPHRLGYYPDYEE